MINVCVRLRTRSQNKYRKITSTAEAIYSTEDIRIETATPYVPGAALEEGEWFFIDRVSNQPYGKELMPANCTSVDYEILSQGEFDSISYLFVEIEKTICFQNISKAKLISKKSIFCIGQDFIYQNNRKEIVINNVPDAIYNKDSDVLYFKRLESITGIFKGIDQLYKEATEEETGAFLSSDFIQLKDGYCASKVKTANRKRIALAQKTLASLDADSRNNIFTYIGEYCPDLQVTATSFEVGSEDELKMLLYGIEQRFYTTVVGGEKRIANSVIPLG